MRIRIGMGFLAGLGILFSTLAFAADSVTLTTYYPSPFGAYDRLKLVPRDTLDTKDFCKSENDLGFIYYDNGKGERKEGVYVCEKMGFNEDTKKDVFDWVLISRPLLLQKGKPVAGKVVCIKDDGKLGTCMQNMSYDGSCGCE